MPVDVRLFAVPSTSAASSPFRLGEAPAHGLTPKALRAQLGKGAVRRVLRGVYVNAATPDSPHLRAAAASLVVPSDAVVCRATAAWLHGVPVRRLPTLDDGLPPIEVCCPAGGGPPRRLGLRGFSALLDAADVVTVSGVPVTSPLRTALDLARWSDRWDGLAFLDAMVRHEVVTLADLRNGLASIDGLPWCEQARELVSYADAGAESAMESFLRLRYLDAGFPRPETQVPILDEDGFPRYRLDCGVRRLRFGFEYDGEEHHGPGHEEHDLARRAFINSRGWRVEVFRKHLVLAQQPHFEYAIAEALGTAPRVLTYEQRRRTRLDDTRRRARTA